jgi:hypothetical protein
MGTFFKHNVRRQYGKIQSQWRAPTMATPLQLTGTGTDRSLRLFEVNLSSRPSKIRTGTVSGRVMDPDPHWIRIHGEET